jgi:flavin reductase (DIM6/NTAB) family NADH-FMN oxidoreductase RutF
MAKKLLKPQTFLIPLPALMISCQQGEEKPDIVTASWVGVCCSEPPMISLALRKSRHSHSIIEKSEEFVVNITTEDLYKVTDFCGMVSGKDVDKFKETQLTPIKGAKVNAPLIKECPINMECEVKKVIHLGSHDLFIGEIVAVHADSDYLDEHNRPDLNKLKPLIYCTKAQEYWGGLSVRLGKYGMSKKKKQ